MAEETSEAFTRREWLENVEAVLAGYESITKLSVQEKKAFCCVAECIEILFAAYFVGIQDTKLAKEACQILDFIRDCEEDLAKILW